MRMPLAYNLKSLARRKGRSAITMLGVSVAVFVAVLMMSLSKGLVASAKSTGSPDNVIVLSRGAESLEFSAIEPSDFHVLKSTGYAADKNGEPLVSPETYINTIVTMPGMHGGPAMRGLVRGVLPVAFDVHEQTGMAAGSPPERGGKIAVGRLAATKLGIHESALRIGSEIEFEGTKWTVSGILDAPGTAFESEIWANLDDLMAAAKRTDFSAVTVKTGGQTAADDLLFDLITRTDIRVEAKLETEYYGGMARAMKPVQVVANLMTVMLALGGMLVAMNTMFTSILGRTKEMAVLLVMGFKRRAVLASFILESLALCGIGGVIGTAAGIALNGMPMKTVMGAFRFSADAEVALLGIAISAVIGIIGAAAPAASVARIGAVEALRSS